MATNESVIASALNQPRDYDMFHFIRPSKAFISATSLASEYVRVFLGSLDGLCRQTSLGLGMDDRGEELTGDGGGGGCERVLFGEHEDSCDAVYVVCHLEHLGRPLCCPIESSLSHPLCSRSRKTEMELQQWIEFPVRYCELLDSTLTCRVHAASGKALGDVTLYPFTSRGELKSGPRRYPLSRSGHPNPVSEVAEVYEVWELVAREKAQGRIADVPWLDGWTQKEVESRKAQRRSNQQSTNREAQNRTALGANGNGCEEAVLSIEFPISSSALPIFFTSIPRDHDADARGCSAGSVTRPHYDLDLGMDPISEAKATILSRSLLLNMADTDVQPGFRERKLLAALVSRPLIQLEALRADDVAIMWRFRTFLSKDAAALVPFMSCVDWHNRAEAVEAERLLTRWKSPSLEDALVCLSYVFRDAVELRKFAVDRLSKESTSRLSLFALQLVQGVRYDSPANELMALLLKLSVEDWVVCTQVYWFLTVEVCIESEAAAKGGSQGNKDTIAARRFTNARDQFLKVLTAEQPEFVGRIQKQVALKDALTTLHTEVHRESKDRSKKIEVAKGLLRQQACGFQEVFSASSSTSMAVDVAPSSISLGEGGAAGEAATTTGSPSKQHSATQRSMRTLPLSLMPSTSNDISPTTTTGGAGSQKSPQVFLPTHPVVPLHGVTDDGFIMFKSAKMPMLLTFLASPPLQEGGGPSPGKKAAKGITYDGGSAMVSAASTSSSLDDASSEMAAAIVSPLPGASIQSDADHHGANNGKDPSRHSNHNNKSPSLPLPSPSTSLKQTVIFKSGDDVRQDQVVIQIIELIDKVLKDNGLDLCLTPYRVLATSPNDGFMEVVPLVKTFQSVQRDVAKYIQQHNNRSSETISQAMDRFVKSCAGYSVVTFLLGIGDRHLENLLITEDGRLLHIDFGFIFGNDPKPFPPPMKICKEMVDGMGGPQSVAYSQFKTYCCSAYNILRKHYSMIMAVLLLMVDASIPQISVGSAAATSNPSQQQTVAVDPRAELIKVQDKFRLDLNNAEATQYIQNVIADSVGAIFTNLWDIIHIAAQAARN